MTMTIVTIIERFGRYARNVVEAICMTGIWRNVMTRPTLVLAVATAPFWHLGRTVCAGESATFAAAALAGPDGLELHADALANEAAGRDPVPELDEDSTLDEYLRYAAVRNPMLKARFLQFRARAERLPQVQALPDPELNFEYALDSGNLRLGLMQMFPWFGTIQARQDAASARARAAAMQFEAARLALIHQVTNAYAEYLYLHRSIEIAGANLDLLSDFEAAALAMFEAGRVGYADVLRTQLELAVLEDTIRGLQQLRPAVTARLNAAMHRAPDAPLPPPKPVMPDMDPLEPRYVLAELKQNNPDLTARHHRIQAAEHDITLAQKRAYPNLGVGLEWMHAGSRGMGGSGDDVMLMFTMNLPLWRDSYRARQREARDIAAGERQELDDAENQLLAQAREAVYELTDSQRRLHFYNDVLLDKARDLVRASEAAYQEGKLDFLGLIDAQRRLLQIELDQARAAADNLQARARLMQLSGGPYGFDAQHQ